MAGQEQELVIDSSVAVKWFSEEEDTDKALLLKEMHVAGFVTLWASDLLCVEVANALRFKSGYEEPWMMLAVESLFDLHLNTYPTDSRILGRASSIALTSDVTVYDALPVALAETKRTLCVTADELTQYKRLKARDYNVRLLHSRELDLAGSGAKKARVADMKRLLDHMRSEDA